MAIETPRPKKQTAILKIGQKSSGQNQGTQAERTGTGT